MKRIVIILIGLISVAYGQSSPTSSKTRFVNGLYVGTKLDSYFNAADSNAIYWRADSVVMAKYKGTARALAFDVTGGYKPISDTFFTSGYTTRARTKQSIDSLGAASRLRQDTYSNVIVFAGDSRTAGFDCGVSGPNYPDQVSTTVPFIKYNSGIGGQISKGMITTAYTNVDPYRSSYGRFNIAVVWIGYNDFAVTDLPQDSTYNNVVAFANMRRSQGWKVIVCTEIDMGGTGSYGPVEDTKNKYNDSLLAHWTEFADGIVRLDTTSQLGVSGARFNATYFCDGVHLTTAGYGVVASMVSQAINRFTFQVGSFNNAPLRVIQSNLGTKAIELYDTLGVSSSWISNDGSLVMKDATFRGLVTGNSSDSIISVDNGLLKRIDRNWFLAKADSSIYYNDVVRTFGDQSILGNKTFLSKVIGLDTIRGKDIKAELTFISGKTASLGTEEITDLLYVGDRSTTGTTYLSFTRNSSLSDPIEINAVRGGVGDDTLKFQTSAKPTIFGGDITANSFIKSGGTSSQFLKANGSIDNSTYLTSADIVGKLNISDTSTMLSPYRRTSTKITNSDLANSTISGISLGNNLNNLTAGNGLIGTDYNGGTAYTWRVDTSTISTKANINALLLGYVDLSSTQSISGAKTFTSTLQANRAASTTVGQIQWTDNVTAQGFLGISAGKAYIHANNSSLILGSGSTNNFANILELTPSEIIGSTSISAKKIIGNSSTPSISGGSASFIGTGASTSVLGNDMAGTATLTTGTGCGSTGASNEAAFTVTFASAYANAPIVLIQAVQRGATTSTDGPSNNLFFLRRSNAGTTGFTVYIPVGTTLTDSTTYDIFYHVIGK